LPILRVWLSPPDSDHLNSSGCQRQLFWCGRPFAPTLREGAEKDKVTDALGVTNGVRDRDRAALGNSEQREPVEPGCVDDGFQITHPCLE
jgi:hypothetical protein